MSEASKRRTRKEMEKARERFEALVHALSADIYRYAFWLCQDEALAKDLCQETFLRAWRAFHQLRDKTMAKSWLLTTVKREYFRVLARRREAADVNVDEIPANGTYGCEVSLEVRELRRAIASLPLKYREPMMLKVIGGYNGEEIAAHLELSRQAVDVRLFRARQKLRKMLAPQADTPIGRVAR